MLTSAVELPEENAAVLVVFSEEAERIASLTRGAAQADVGDTAPLEEALARGRAELERLLSEKIA